MIVTMNAGRDRCLEVETRGPKEQLNTVSVNRIVWKKADTLIRRTFNFGKDFGGHFLFFDVLSSATMARMFWLHLIDREFVTKLTFPNGSTYRPRQNQVTVIELEAPWKGWIVTMDQMDYRFHWKNGKKHPRFRTALEAVLWLARHALKETT